jgi:hypothetical protein
LLQPEAEAEDKSPVSNLAATDPSAMLQLKFVTFFGVEFSRQQLQELMMSSALKSFNFYSSRASNETYEQLDNDHPDVLIRVDGSVLIREGSEVN